MFNRSISGPKSESSRVGAHSTGLAPVITLVLWSGCLLVGGLGFALPYKRPLPPAPIIAPVTAEKIVVHLIRAPQLATESIPAVDSLPSPPPAPPVAAVTPSPSLTLVLSVTGPVRTAAPPKVSSTHEASAAASISTTPVQPLVFGRGEGRQPAPLYPSTAIRSGMEGTVGIRLNVDENGRVLSAEVSSPSPWPLLNESALRAVRELWHFSPGIKRTYEVSFPFILKK